MTNDENKLLIRIGQELAAMIGKNPDGAYSYTEVQEMYMAPSAYHDEGNRVVCYRPSPGFCDAIWDLWYKQEPEKRWAAMRYEIVDGQFSVEFDYPEQHDPNELDDYREERALKARYGDKPIVYPKPDDWPELTEADLSDE